MFVEGILKAKNIASATTTLVKAGPGMLKSVIINKAVINGVITIYDGIDASGTKLATITHPGTLIQSQYFLPIEHAIQVGLCVVTSSTDDVTIIYG